ncbi:MAG: type II toxin-antitoxin system RelE family toxin [Terriglobia bacterium]
MKKSIILTTETRRHRGRKKLQRESNLFRLRSGNYRITYSIEDVRLVVLVIRIGQRRDVYRGL